MFHIIQDVFTLKAIWGFIMSTSHEFLQGRLVAAWSDESAWDSFMDKHSVVSYIIESTVMDVFDDMKEYGINPWYHPVASFKQVMYPLVRFFWEIFGKSPVFWLIVAVWTIRWAVSNYNFYYTYLVEAINTCSSWWRNRSLVFWNRSVPATAENAPAAVEDAPAPAENAPAPAENASPADNAPSLADNAPPADDSLPADDAPPADDALPAENAPSADNDPTPNGNAPATTAAAKNPLMAENTLIPNGDAPAANGKA